MANENFVRDLSASGVGLEIAPYFYPRLLKSECNVLYTDMISNEEIAAKALDNPDGKTAAVPQIDFVWTPGKALKDCAPVGVQFDYVLAAHVVEHVPDTIGWLNNILEVTKVGGRLGLYVPNKGDTFDYYRALTEVSDLVGSFVERRSIPTPAQVYDFMSKSIEYRKGTAVKIGEDVEFSSLKRSYTDPDALNLSIETYVHNKYLDVHCTVWTAETFVSAFRKISELGLMNVNVSDAVETASDEFTVILTKMGEPSISAPISPYQKSLDDLKADLEHARKAFKECAEGRLSDEIKYSARMSRLIQEMGNKPLWRRLLNK